MELTYPLIIYIGIVVVAVTFIATIIVLKKYKGGRKLANASLVKEIPHYKWLLFRYAVLKFFMMLSLISALILTLYIASKPTEVRTYTTERHNRDIFICFDVSTSLDGINIEMCEQLKSFVKHLKGERFGISIFNAQSIEVVPLTSDYDYIVKQLDALEETIIAGYDGQFNYETDSYVIYGDRFSGTLSSYGSSLIGDGLASALYDFPDLDEDPERSRLIIFVTDNDLQGNPIVTIDQACELCRNHGVKVFALAPDRIVVDEENFSHSIRRTHGEYYNTRDDDALEDLLEDVKKTDVNTVYTSQTTAVDVPEKAVIALVISLLIYFVCARRLRL